MARGGVLVKNWADRLPAPPAQGPEPDLRAINEFLTEQHAVLKDVLGELYGNAELVASDATSPQDGAIRFNDTTKVLEVYDGVGWALLGGQDYGSVWGNEIGWSQATAAENTWYAISDADIDDGSLNKVTHDGSGELTVAYAGDYFIHYALSINVSRIDKHIQSGISVTGTVQDDGIQHILSYSANQDIAMSCSAILTLAASDTIEIAVRNTNAAPNLPTIAIDHLNMSVMRIG